MCEFRIYGDAERSLTAGKKESIKIIGSRKSNPWREEWTTGPLSEDKTSATAFFYLQSGLDTPERSE
jgi:hypothetical protein